MKAAIKISVCAGVVVGSGGTRRGGASLRLTIKEIKALRGAGEGCKASQTFPRRPPVAQPSIGDPRRKQHGHEITGRRRGVTCVVAPPPVGRRSAAAAAAAAAGSYTRPASDGAPGNTKPSTPLFGPPPSTLNRDPAAWPPLGQAAPPALAFCGRRQTGLDPWPVLGASGGQEGCRSGRREGEE
ncbi:hypothetical protein E2C01_061590 [Portunus trituberculatus]|uniref:Uncharacterized protein n=1 Tax=Portunus trituberculatus TaxID=210409 RepID=A0A5B7HCT3_PORTR|nr:hypothetical protein [Portunus trituberculatus]